MRTSKLKLRLETQRHFFLGFISKATIELQPQIRTAEQNLILLPEKKTVVGPFRVNSQEVVRSPSPIFLKFFLKLSLPHMMNICKI